MAARAAPTSRKRGYMKFRTFFLWSALCLGPFVVTGPAPIVAQGPTASAEMPPMADPDDVESIDAIIEALYGVISGPAGQERDWDRFKSLFIPGARLIPTGKAPSGQVGYQVWSPAEYAEAAGPSLEGSGFFEVEIARQTDTYGEITQLFSTYESRQNEDDAEPFARGINSIQLLNDGERWWIVSIFWAGERPDLTIPGQYLPGM